MTVKKQLIKIGDRVDLYLGTGPVYRTMLEDITNNKNLLVSVPIYKGMPVSFAKNQELQMYFYRTNGRYRANVKMVGYQHHDQLTFLELQVLSEPQKQQRRDSFRINEELKVVMSYIDNDLVFDRLNSSEDDREVAYSINISVTGIAVKTKKAYSVGDKVFMRIYLMWPDAEAEPLEIIGEIRQVDMINPLQKVYNIGIMFLYTSKEVSGNLSKYVMAREQKRLKQKRLVEDD
ncbi:MAG: flagellar brake protein [Clostridiales bacterium]|nr:flagellar brake protein [Clostridiales bacterium]